MDIDIRLTIDDRRVGKQTTEQVAAVILYDILTDTDHYFKSGVVLKNDGFGNLLPDEESRVNKD
jgi:hypothetical protein